MWTEIDEWARYILLLKWPYSADVYLFSLYSISFVNARKGKERYVFNKVHAYTCASLS